MLIVLTFRDVFVLHIYHSFRSLLSSPWCKLQQEADLRKPLNRSLHALSRDYISGKAHKILKV